MTRTTTAAWLQASGRLLELGPADVPHPGAGQIVVRAEAVAVNPVDWIVQAIGSAAYRSRRGMSAQKPVVTL